VVEQERSGERSLAGGRAGARACDRCAVFPSPSRPRRLCLASPLVRFVAAAETAPCSWILRGAPQLISSPIDRLRRGPGGLRLIQEGSSSAQPAQATRLGEPRKGLRRLSRSPIASTSARISRKWSNAFSHLIGRPCDPCGLCPPLLDHRPRSLCARLAPGSKASKTGGAAGKAGAR
jgi:hypothetical protein